MFDDQRVPSFVRLFLGSVWGAEIILGKCRSPFFVRFWVNIFFHMSLLMMMWPRVKNIEKHCSPMLTHGWMDFILQRWLTTWRADTEVSTRIRPVSGYQTMFRLNHTINTWNNYSRPFSGNHIRRQKSFNRLVLKNDNHIDIWRFPEIAVPPNPPF
jgi:hypothetical protein